MDLTLFIVLILLAFMMYHMISAIQSLIQEMREVKNKCIKVNNVNIEDFNVSTPNPTDVMKRTLNNLKNAFTDKKI